MEARSQDKEVLISRRCTKKTGKSDTTFFFQSYNAGGRELLVLGFLAS